MIKSDLRRVSNSNSSAPSQLKDQVLSSRVAPPWHQNVTVVYDIGITFLLFVFWNTFIIISKYSTFLFVMVKNHGSDRVSAINGRLSTLLSPLDKEISWNVRGKIIYAQARLQKWSIFRGKLIDHNIRSFRVSICRPRCKVNYYSTEIREGPSSQQLRE